MIDLDEIERLARAATPGEWKVEEPHGPPLDFRYVMPIDRTENALATVWHGDGDDAGANAAYIAAMSPPTILALIARLRAADAVADAAQHHPINLSRALAVYRALMKEPAA